VLVVLKIGENYGNMAFYRYGGKLGTAISGNIWGVVESLKHYWDRINKGDLLFF